MSNNEYTDETLNMFIDEELDTLELHRVHEDLLADPELRERVCQLKAVRELVGYAYENEKMPESASENTHRPLYSFSLKTIAATVLMAVGALIGWNANHIDVLNSNRVATPNSVFHFYKNKLASNVTKERKIILHLTTSNVRKVNAALEEAESLLASYRESGTPMKLEIITTKEAVNVLRVGVSPYVTRIEKLVSENDNLSLYACRRTIEKLLKKEGEKAVFMRDVIVNESAAEIIPDRIKRGWVYIRA